MHGKIAWKDGIGSWISTAPPRAVLSWTSPPWAVLSRTPALGCAILDLSILRPGLCYLRRLLASHWAVLSWTSPSHRFGLCYLGPPPWAVISWTSALDCAILDSPSPALGCAILDLPLAPSWAVLS